MNFQFNSGFRLLWGILLLLHCAGLQAGNFPLPESIKPNVEFWKLIYSEVEGDFGLMHDSRNLGIIYNEIRVPANAARHVRKRIIGKERERLKALLYRIASRSVNQLSGEEKHIRSLFPAKASTAEIKAAARHIRFQKGQADKFRKAVQRSGYYRSYIEAELKQQGLPLELAALPFVESSFNIRAYSHVGASGIWQFMPATGRRFMKVNHVIDERYDPFRATRAAVSLLKYNYSILGSWPLALTAYNHGVGGMRRAVRKTGTKDIGVIVHNYRSRTFGFASRNFYSEFLAALHVAQNAEKYFPGVKPFAPVRYAEFELDDFVPARSLAKTLGVNLDELRLHNLALREPVWEGDKHLPKDYSLRVPARLLRADINILLAQVPESERHSEQIPDVTYRVRKGDSLSRIAGIYGVRVSELVAMNNLRSKHRIRVGQVLYLPQKGKVIAKPVPAQKPAEKPLVVASAEPEVVSKKPLKPDAVTSAEKPAVQQNPESETPPEDLVEEMSEAGEAADDPSATEIASITDIDSVEKVLVEDEVRESIAQIAATDPAEYSVDKNSTIEIQAAETLGHYADWLGLKASHLRKINRMSYRSKLIIGKRILLDFSRVGPQEFEAKRIDYHKRLEDDFFARKQIVGTRQYRIKRGDSLWVIANKRSQAPLWLIRQHNPDIDFATLKPGDAIVLPLIQDKKKSA